jgi:hypothetical protein
MLYAPHPHRPTSVFPDFTRSLSADGFIQILICIINKHANINTTGHKSGQRPAGKRGPGSFASRVEGFFRLDVWLLSIKRK